MRYLKYIIAFIYNWLTDRKRIKHCFVKDLPVEIFKGKIYIVGDSDYSWLAAFKCPCGCKKTIQLNLLKEASPSWSYIIKNEKITLKPSVWGTAGCKSHFFIRAGKVRWAK